MNQSHHQELSTRLSLLHRRLPSFPIFHPSSISSFLLSPPTSISSLKTYSLFSFYPLYFQITTPDQSILFDQYGHLFLKEIMYSNQPLPKTIILLVYFSRLIQGLGSHRNYSENGVEMPEEMGEVVSDAEDRKEFYVEEMLFQAKNSRFRKRKQIQKRGFQGKIKERPSFSDFLTITKGEEEGEESEEVEEEEEDEEWSPLRIEGWSEEEYRRRMGKERKWKTGKAMKKYSEDMEIND